MTLRFGEVVLGVLGTVLMGTGIYVHNGALAGSTAAPRPSGAAAASKAKAAAPSAFAIVDADVFDGHDMLGKVTVLVENGRITAVGRGLAVPPGVDVVRAQGKALLPGLIDAHTHAFQDALPRALVFGVTTEIDMFTDIRYAAAQRGEQSTGVVGTRADLVSSGTLATATRGHGTEYGIAIPTLTRPDEAQAFVDARVGEGADFIKIIYDDGAAYGRHVPSLDRPTMGALIEAAHRRGKLAVVHVVTCQAAREAIEAGADGLAHAPADLATDPALISLMQRRKAFVVPTLSVVAAMSGEAAPARSLEDDSSLGMYVSDIERRTLDASFPSVLQSGAGLARASALTGALHRAGVRILAGTDAPNPGTAHGPSLHGELELLVRAGVSPAAALAAATGEVAATFHLADRGRVAPGLRADLVLVDGDPLQDIRATRRIAMIWKGGVPVERKVAASQPMATVDTDGRVSDFERDAGVAFGSAWQVSTDALLGGTSEAALRVVAGGARGTRGALEISGRMKPGAMYPWAGAMFFPGATPMAPVDLSRFTELTFWAKGDGGSYQVLLFSTRTGRIPVARTFTAGPAWREIVLPLSEFGNGVDGRGLQAVLVSGSAGQSEFRLQIDEVRFR